jgi:hypothetical protein
VLAGIAGERTELVQELALLASAGPHVAWRQSPRQIVPTGLLHVLIVICSGRICFDATGTRRVGAILKQRARLPPMRSHPRIHQGGGTGVAWPVLAFSLGPFMHYHLFVRSDLIPRWLSGWGVAAIVLTIGARVLSWFRRSPLTTYSIALLPIAVQEMALAVWPVLRGLNLSALGAFERRRSGLTSAGERPPSDTVPALVAERAA